MKYDTNDNPVEVAGEATNKEDKNNLDIRVRHEEVNEDSSDKEEYVPRGDYLSIKLLKLVIITIFIVFSISRILFAMNDIISKLS